MDKIKEVFIEARMFYKTQMLDIEYYLIEFMMNKNMFYMKRKMTFTKQYLNNHRTLGVFYTFYNLPETTINDNEITSSVNMAWTRLLPSRGVTTVYLFGGEAKFVKMKIPLELSVASTISFSKKDILHKLISKGFNPPIEHHKIGDVVLAFRR